MLERLAFSLELIGIYNLAINFLSGSDFFKTFPSWQKDMTSADLRSFSAATLRTLGIFASISSLAVRGFPPPMITGRLPLLLQVLAVVVLGLTFAIVCLVLLPVVVLVVVVGIAPIAYIGYVLVDALLDAVVSSPADMKLWSAEGSLSLKDTVEAHQVELRPLLVGVPAVALGLVTGGYALLA
jgi:hypothetical protein